MNPLDYGSRKVCQKLFEKGIVLKTKKCWIQLASGKYVSANTKKKIPLSFWFRNPDIPAPSMFEAWRELLPFVFGHYVDMRDRVWKALLSDNPTDALIELIIWLAEQGKKKGEKG